MCSGLLAPATTIRWRVEQRASSIIGATIRSPDGVELDRFMGATCRWLCCGREQRQAMRCSGAAALPLE